MGHDVADSLVYYRRVVMQFECHLRKDGCRCFINAFVEFFAQLEQWLFFGRKPRCVLHTEGRASSAGIINDATCWLLYEERARLIDDEGRDVVERHLGFLLLKTLGSESNQTSLNTNPSPHSPELAGWCFIACRTLMRVKQLD